MSTSHFNSRLSSPSYSPPSRETLLGSIQTQEFDLVVIGGGATGVGVALEAASRGLHVALLEGEDFASATSSRSTKLAHGGVRYLEQAFLGLDRGQFRLVQEALHERATILRMAPHLAHSLPILTPVYRWWESWYYWLGLKAYDWLSGSESLHCSEWISKELALKYFPYFQRRGLRGAVCYYDGQFNDARLNVTLALTALSKGAFLVNHMEVTEFLKSEEQRLVGVKAIDRLSGESFIVRGKVLVNATGPFTDRVRRLDDPECRPLIVPSMGSHILLNRSFSPQDHGILIPKTDDGRVLFLLPWEGKTLAGTTDHPSVVTRTPRPTLEEVDYILRHLERYFDLTLSLEDVESSWSGLRPLVLDPKIRDTSRLSREHVIDVSSSGLLTIAGGKWTIFRKMAQDTVEKAISLGSLSPSSPSISSQLVLLGGEHYQKDLAEHLSHSFDLESDVAEHLASTYGDCAEKVVKIAQQGYSDRLAERFPYLEAEVLYGVRYELACTAVDLLARRTRLAFLSQKGALGALPRVLELMSEELCWSQGRRELEREAAVRFLETMGVKGD